MQPPAHPPWSRSVSRKKTTRWIEALKRSLRPSWGPRGTTAGEETMWVRQLGVCLAFVLGAFALPARADELRLQVGPLYAGISVPDAIAAVPDSKWTESRSTPSGILRGARAERAVVFNNAAWDVTLGRVQEFGDVPDERDVYENAYDLRLERRLRSPRECRNAFAATVVALEALLGPFGQDSEFSNASSRLFSDQYGLEMRIDRIGENSRVRIWPRHRMPPMYTLREPSEGF